MSWLKRNLYFVIGSFVAIALMGWAGYYLFQNLQANGQAYEDWSKQNAELQRLQGLNPHPGYRTPRPGQLTNVDNIKIATQQADLLGQELGKARGHFTPIAPIPRSFSAGSEELEFKTQLATTIRNLRETARKVPVTVDANYNFTFESVVNAMRFTRQSLRPLAVELGEVKAVCEVLFAARINALVGIKREKVCPEDKPEVHANDYLDQTSVTNELKVVLAPVEITFNCFSTELASVLVGFANSPHGFIVQALDYKPAPAAINPASLAATPTAGGISNPYRRTLSPEQIRDYMMSHPGDSAGLQALESGARMMPTPSPGARPGAPTVEIDEKLVQVTALLAIPRFELSAPPPGRAGGPQGARGRRGGGN